MSVEALRNEEFEYAEEVANPVHPGARRLVVRLSVMGGGTLGRAYSGRWVYRVTQAGGTGSAVVIQGDDLRTGTPKTHRQTVRIVEDFLIDRLGER